MTENALLKDMLKDIDIRTSQNIQRARRDGIVQKMKYAEQFKEQDILEGLLKEYNSSLEPSKWTKDYNCSKDEFAQKVKDSIRETMDQMGVAIFAELVETLDFNSMVKDVIKERL